MDVARLSTMRRSIDRQLIHQMVNRAIEVGRGRGRGEGEDEKEREECDAMKHRANHLSK